MFYLFCITQAESNLWNHVTNIGKVNYISHKSGYLNAGTIITLWIPHGTLSPWRRDEKLTLTVHIARRMICRIMTDVCFWVRGNTT